MEVALNAGDPLPGRATGHGCALTGIFDDLLKMSCYGVAQAEPGYWLDFAMANGSPSLHVLKEEDVFHGIEMIYAAGLEPARRDVAKAANYRSQRRQFEAFVPPSSVATGKNREAFVRLNMCRSGNGVPER